MSSRIKYRLQHQLRPGCGSSDFGAVLHGTVTQHRSGNVSAMTIGITSVSRSSERVQSKHAPGKRWMNVIGSSLIKSGVGDGNDLPGSLERSPRLHVVGVQDLPRDIVRQLWRDIRLDAPHFVDRGDVVQ